jgi:hypothetical protein
MDPVPGFGVYVLIRELDRQFPRAEPDRQFPPVARERRNHVRAIAAILAGPLRAWHATRQGTEHAASVAAAAPSSTRSVPGNAR